MKVLKHPYIILLFVMLAFSCADNSDLVDFTIEEEAMLGEKISEVIIADPEYAYIPRESNPIVYGYADSRLSEIVSSSFLAKTSFNWTVILLDREDRSAFATPGGYIYVNTGMIFYLENEDQFSGMLAHMVAHVDSSHIVNRLFFEFGINSLKSIANGNNEESLRNVLSKLDVGFGQIEFSRNDEIEADTHALMLLSETTQSCTSNGSFMERVLNVQPEQQRFFVASHGSKDARLEDATILATTVGCDETVDDESSTRYRSFRNSLP